MNVAVVEVPAARLDHSKEWFVKMNGDDANVLRGISPDGSDAIDEGFSAGFHEKSPSCATVLPEVSKEFLDNGRTKRWFAAGCAVSPNGGRLFAKAKEIV